MKSLEDWAAVQKVYKSTGSIRETAKLLHISKNTVKKLLDMDKPPKYKRTIYASKIDSYKDLIIQWRCQPYLYNGTRIFRELKAHGYTGSISPVYRYLKRLDEDIGPEINSKATVRIETPPGDQAQFDWSEYVVMVNGRYRKVYCFSMILAASRKKAVCFSLKDDADSIYEAIQDLFDELGGVTLELLIDNPKALVLENNPKNESEIKYNPHALMVAKTLGTELNACPCYWPRKKGKIERPFNYIEEQFLKGKSFASMEDLNKQVKENVYEWCNEKHSTTRRIPNEHYLLEEKQVLLPLPEYHYYQNDSITRIVSPDSYVSIDSSKYSVPVKYVGKKVSFRKIYGYKIIIYDSKGSVIKTVQASDSKYEVLRDIEDYEPIMKRVSTSIPQIKRDFTERFTNGSRYFEKAYQIFDQPTFHARKIMELQDLYDDETLNKFIGIAIDEDKMDIKSFLTLLREYNKGNIQKSPPDSVSKETSSDDLTRECSYYEDNLLEDSHV